MHEFSLFSNYKPTKSFSIGLKKKIIKSPIPMVMGIINTTPDSFFDGFSHKTTDYLLKTVEQYIQDGANIIDIGGESTRPYAQKLNQQEEIDRTAPIIQIIKNNFDIPISIDTYKSEVATIALEVGATIVNDISGMTLDPQMEDLILKNKPIIILCHIQGSPQNMQDKPQYTNVVQEVCSFLNQQSQKLIQQGLPKEHICLDPGIGFGKNLEHNISILKSIDRFKEINSNILIGLSRKSFIGKISGLEKSNRLIPSVILNLFSSLQGASILRTHDVKETSEALKLVYSFF